jgi:Domain of unknown function (DUF4259)
MPSFDEPQLYEAQRAIAAAELVAATYAAVGSDLPDDVQAWLDAHPGSLEPSILDLARSAITRIQAEALTLKEVWFDPENATAWMNSVDDLRHRLDHAIAPVRVARHE